MSVECVRRAYDIVAEDYAEKFWNELGFKVIDLLIRYPYPEVEYQSKRAYVLLSKT